jgi:myo-inositol 2-dehydrogenase / D-chiro-inositol 1-dehydrogenase
VFSCQQAPGWLGSEHVHWAGWGRPYGVFHAATLRGLDSVEQVVVADANLARAQAVAKEFDLEVAPDVESLLGAGLDRVAICAASSTHMGLIGRAQDAGHATFCEKPLASDVAGTPRISGRVADGLVPVHIGFHVARQAVTGGGLGWIHTICSNTNVAAPSHASYIPTSGAFFRDASIHDFDAVRFVIDREVASVFAVGQNRGEALFAQSDDIEAAAAVLTMDDGTIALISGSRYNARGYDVRMEALGSKDSVCVGMDDRLPRRSIEERVDFPAAMPYTGFMERFHQAYVDELVAFTDLVAGTDRDAVFGPGGSAGLSGCRGMRAFAARGPSGADGGDRTVMAIRGSRRECSTAMSTDHEVERRRARSRHPIMRLWLRSTWPPNWRTEVRHE